MKFAIGVLLASFGILCGDEGAGADWPGGDASLAPLVARAVWDLVVGDDWRPALAAVVAIGLTALVCALGLSAWWPAPIVALGALRWSLRDVRPSATSASSTSS